MKDKKKVGRPKEPKSKVWATRIKEHLYCETVEKLLEEKRKIENESKTK